MKRNILPHCFRIAVLASGTLLLQSATAADSGEVFASPKAAGAPPPVPELDWRSMPRVTLEPLGYTNLNRVGISYRMGFNMSVSFNRLGGYTALTPLNNPLRTADGERANYDNGYVYDDQAPPAQDTHYYGYVEGTRIYPENGPLNYGPKFDLYRSSAAASVSSKNSSDDEPQHGFEVTYSRQLGRVREAFWGLEGGVGFMDFSASDDRTLRGAALRQTDTFEADPAGPSGFLAPSPAASFPSVIPFGDPGWPSILLAPVGQTTESFANAMTITGRRLFDAQMMSLRFGPYLDVPLNERWTFSLGGGVTVLHIDSDFRFTETVTLDPAVTLVTLPAQTRRASGSHDDWLVGGYVGASFAFAVNDRLRLFSGAHFQATGDYTHSLAGKSAVLHLGQAILVSLGGSWSF